MRRILTPLIILSLLVSVSPAAFARPSPASTPPAGVSDLVAGNTAFALDLYAALRQDADGNLLVSPYSVSQALAMTYAGAGGETALQMAEVLGFALPQPALHEAFAALNADLVARGNAEASEDDSETLRALNLADALWGEQTYPFSEGYRALLARYYGAGLQPHDFKHAPEGVRQQINGWVAEQTRDRIQDVVPAGEIDSCSRLALANAIYFDGVWQHPFDPDATRDDAFHLRDGTAATAPFMVQQVGMPYARGDGYQAIEFPYADSGFALTVILPDLGQFDAVEAGLNPDALNTAIGHLADTEVLVYLPKFEFTFGTINLKETLQALGMVDAFSDHADFTGMLDGPLPAEPHCVGEGIPPKLTISKVWHKAFISVDEERTEAAAATVVVASPVGAAMPTEPIEVRIDRPFIFAIRDRQTGTVLFLGRVMDPSQ